MPEMQTDDVIRFSLGANGTFAFNSIEEVKSWFDAQKSFHSDLLRQDRRNPIPGVVAESVERQYRQINIANGPVTSWDKSVQTHFLQQIQTYFAADKLPTKESSRGKLLASMPPVSAAYALAWYLGINVPLNTESSAGLIGLVKAILAELGAEGILNEPAANALSALHDNWSQALDSAKQTKSKLKATFEHEIAAQRKATQEHKQQLSVTLEETKRQVDEQTARAEQSLAEKLKNAEERLVAVEKTYDEKLALQSAVAYWGDKAVMHKQWSIFWGLLVLFAGAAASQFIFHSVKETLHATRIADAQLWQVTQLALVAVFGVWIMRLLVRLLLSNTHLHTDASERRTMMLTYLAMMRERQLPEDGSRKLILQALFRPSSTGIIKDDASPPFMAEWIRATVGKD